MDLAIGTRNGRMSYFENVGFAGEPLYVARTGDDNPFDGVSAAS